MPSTTLPPLPLPTLVAQPTEQESFIDQRLRQTRRQVKTVDIVGGLATLAIGAIAYLLVVALADHWLFAGGLATWTRWLLWLGLVGAAGAYIFFRLLPPIIRRVNPVFAALTIETSQPTLRNSLINFLLLRGRRQEITTPIYNTLEQRAAADLTKVRVETTVDRAHLIRLCQVLAVVLAVYCLYLVISPKNPLNSAGRILFPWSNIEATTRVTIDEVRPGDTRAFHGEFLTVSAEIAGLRDDETPTLIYSTADGQVVDQSTPMTLPEGEYRFQCLLPPGKTGLQQNYQYHITAGDYRTRDYTIEVHSAPAIVVDRVVYDYPDYTGLADLTDETGGDLRAIEGTEVTIHATANAEIKPDTAEIDLGCTGRRGLPMSVKGLEATGQFRLTLNPDDDNSPLYDSYLLRFSNAEGRENPHPVRHRIEVVRDLPPDVQVIEPKEPEVHVAENGQVAISVEAKDPDFALRRVEIRAVRDDNRSLAIAPLLDKRRPAEPVAGEFQGSFVFEPAKYNLKAGARVQYWAVAEDNREPTPNRTETEKRWIIVESPQSQDEQQQGDKSDRPDQPKDQQQPGEKSEQRQNGDQPPQDPAEEQQSEDGEQSKDGEQGGKQDGEKSDAGQDGEQSAENQQGENQSGSEKQNGDGNGGEQQQGDPSQSGEEQNQRVDPEAEPGDAMQEILKDKQQQDKQQQENPQPDGQEQSEKQQDQQEKQSEQQRQDGAQQQGNEQNQPGEQQSAEEGSQQGDQQSGGEQSSSEEKGEQQSGPGQSGGDQNQSTKPQPGEQEPSGDDSSGSESSQEKGDSKQSADQKSPGEKAEDQPDGKGEKSDGQKQEGEESARSGDEKKEPGEKTDEKSPDGQGKDGKTGEQQQPDNDDNGKGDNQSGDKRTGQQDVPGDKEEPNAEPGGASPNEEGKPDNKQRPDKAGDAPGERKDQETPAPGKGDKESSTQSETSGDRNGKGEEGGGQQSNQSGVGGPGSNTPSDEGASQADQKGEGETGSKAGDQKASQTPTGSDHKAEAEGGAQSGEEQGKTTPDGRSPAGKQSDSNEPSQQNQPPQTSDNSGIATEGGSSESKDGVKGKAAGGGKSGTSDSSDPDKTTDTGPDRANIDYARRQTELALEHLRDQLAKEKPELLDKLGWTKDDARRFLNRWEQMQRAAAKKGPDGKQAKRQFDEALKSLGLGSGTELKHGGVEADTPETQRDAGRSAPPPDWADHLRAYTRGVAGEEEKK